MKTQLTVSQKVKVRVIEYEEKDILELAQNGKLSELTVAINADRRQKVALVAFRADASEKIEAKGFSRKTTTVTKDGETSEVPSETEGDHIQRWIDALASGSFTEPDFTLPSGDDQVKETAALAHFQKLAFTCGDHTDDDGNPAYKLDVNRPERTASKGILPKWALEAAGNIIKNNSQAKWIKNFTEGYTSGSGITIDPIPFESFGAHAPAHATPEEKELVHKTNQKRLASAIVTVRKQEEAKRAPEFA